MADGDNVAHTIPLDSGLLAFVSPLRFLGKPADLAQLRHEFAPDSETFTPDHILRTAKRLELKVRRERVPPERLEKASLPARERERKTTAVACLALAVGMLLLLAASAAAQKVEGIPDAVLDLIAAKASLEPAQEFFELQGSGFRRERSRNGKEALQVDRGGRHCWKA